MKWIIASDLHGSAAWCRRLLTEFSLEKAERLVLLGDLLYHGPRNPLPESYDPPFVASMLNGLKDRILCVRGNCDAEVDQLVLEFPILADYAFLCLDGKTICATHGHRYGPDNPPPLGKGDILLCGHFHQPVCQDKGDFAYWNPGSLSLPKNGTPHSFMVLEDGVPSWRNISTGEAFTPLSAQV